MEKQNNQFLEDLIKSVYEDFNKRQEERREIEKQWKLNINYLVGNQYCEVSPTGEVIDEDKNYFWQSRCVFNHIAPIYDARISKLNKIRPAMSVRASSGEESDLKTAEISSQILNATCQNINFDKVIKNVTEWSEVLGTGFYKITWNEKGGKNISNTNKPIYEGDVNISCVSPFEIFPDCLYATQIKDLKSIIHARPMDVNDIEKLYNVELKGEDINVFTFGGSGFSYNGGYKETQTSSVVHNSVMVIEKYEKPTKNYPNGRVITVAGGKLLCLGELPYKNGIDGEREFPFVKQISLSKAGSFFGSSFIERVIPIQKSYNAVKNRKHEFLNRLSMGIITVEDGSTDVESLEGEGLSPGKIIVYRQGSKPPQLFGNSNIPNDFTYEEDRLLKEFSQISGTSELTRNINSLSSTLSGSAIELLIEQDDSRISSTAESIKDAVKEIAKQILRLYKQFAKDIRIIRIAGENNKVKLFYFKGSDISCDDVIFDTEYEFLRSPAQQKSAILEMLNTGLLSNEEGKITDRTKAKILELLGYSSLNGTQDIINLHRNKAETENIEVTKRELFVEEYDDHNIHIEEHTRKLLSMETEDKNKESKEKLIKHLKEHKTYVLSSVQTLNGEKEQ